MKHQLTSLITAALLAVCTVPALWAQDTPIGQKPVLLGSAVDAANDDILGRDASAGAGNASIFRVKFNQAVAVPGFFANLPNSSFTLAKLAQSGATSGQAVVWNGSAWAAATVSSNLTSGPVTSSGGVSAIADAALSIAKTSGLQTALDAKVATTTLSTVGGANKVPVMDANANWTTGNYVNNHVIMGNGGNIYIPDTRGLNWLRQDGTQSGNYITVNQNHDGNGGEMYIQCANRLAALTYGTFQIGVGDPVRYACNAFLNSGAATSTDTVRASYPVMFASNTWNSGAGGSGLAGIQLWPTQQNGANPVLRFTTNAYQDGQDGGSGGTTIGNVTGDQMAEMSKDGINSPGIAPAYTTLTDGATITVDCNKYRDTQAYKLQLGGNRTLAFTNTLPGMRGIIYVQQDATGSRTLTLPNGSATASGWALSTAAYTVDRLYWDYDGTYIYWTMTKGLVLPTDADASAFFTRASVSDNTQMTAVNNFVLSLKGAGLWTKLDCIYPFVGGNATAHSKNLKSNTYNITWAGGLTHDANGVTGNGSSGWGNTGYEFSTGSQQNDAFGAVYCKTISPGNGYLLGTTNTNALFGIETDSGFMWVDGPNCADHRNAGNSPANFKFLAYLSRYSSTHYVYGWTGGGGNFESDRTISSIATTTRPIGLLAQNQGASAAGFSNANIALAVFGKALTSGEIATLSGIITTYQTALSRQN